MAENLRRVERISVCCRAVVRDRYGVWTGVTHDIGKRGCQIVTSRQLRSGTRVLLTLSSDLFVEDLEAVAEVVWVTPERLGMVFLEPRRRSGSLTPSAWVDLLLVHGAQPYDGVTRRVVPCVRRVEGHGTAVTVRHDRIVRTAPGSAPSPRTRLSVRPSLPHVAGAAGAGPER
jgi:hypothetical protein